MTSLATFSPAGSAQGRVRWRRFAAIFIPALLVIVVMFVLVAQGALGVSFAVSGKPFTVKASQLSGDNFQQWGTADLTANNTAVPVFVSSFSSATLANLCQSVSTGLPGPFANLKIAAGGNGTPASASNLVVDAQSLTADNAVFSNINIGQDPTTFGRPAPGAQAGSFGQSASHVEITNANQTAIATSAGTFTLPGLSLSFASTGC